MTLGAGDFVQGHGHIVKMQYFFSSCLLFGRVYQIVNFMTLILGCRHVSRYIEYALSSSLLIYSASISIVLWDNNAAFLCRFFLFAVDMQL